jgi:rod shape-determining protein MreC
MNPVFKHGPSQQYRLLLVLMFSAALMFFDHKVESFEHVRGSLQTLVSPLQYIANAPKQVIVWSSENVTTRKNLIRDNLQYKVNELRLHEQLMQFDSLKRENNRLRSLLASPLRIEVKKMVAEIISVDGDPYTQQLVINRGAKDGAYEGQAVIDEQGVIGQILHVGVNSSRVILITDVSHAVPVRSARNGTRLIASGIGRSDLLNHQYVPHSADIREGDLLITSGLGGKFPKGYPVAKVLKVVKDESRPFAQVYSRPIAQMDKLRYLLLLYNNVDHNLSELTTSPKSKDALNLQLDSTKNKITDEITHER